MVAISQIDDALEYLKSSNCKRDCASGQWLNRDGDPLGSDPATAALELRRLTIKRAVEASRRSLTGMHR